MSLKRETIKGHYRWVVRNSDGTIKTSKKWSPKHAFPCEFYTCEECPIDDCILEKSITDEQKQALRELDHLFTKLAMDDSLWDEDNNPIQKEGDKKVD